MECLGVKARNRKYRVDCFCENCTLAKSKHIRGNGARLQPFRDRSIAGYIAYHSSVDESAVIRAVRGDRPDRMTRAERQESVRRLLVREWSNEKIAAHLRISERTVDRMIVRIKQEANTC